MRRYKHVFSRGHTYLPFLGYSADGLAKQNYTDDPIAGLAADTMLSFQWLPRSHRYWLVMRANLGTPHGWREVRGLRVLTNPDIKADPKNWTVAKEW